MMLKVVTVLLVAVIASCKLSSGCPEGCVCLGLEPGLPCAACRKGFYLQSGTCVSNCAPGFVQNGTKWCDPCPASCLKCTTEGRCVQCRRPALLTMSGKCVTFNTHYSSREAHLPTSDVIDVAFTVPKGGLFSFSLRHVLEKLDDKSRVNFVIAPKFGTMLIREANRSKLLHEGDYLDMQILHDSELSYASRGFPQSAKDFAAFVVAHRNHHTLIKVELNAERADDSRNYVKDSSPTSLRITEGDTVLIPRNHFRLEAFSVPESHLFLRLKTSLKFGSLLADGRLITAGHFFNHELLSQDKLAYQCSGETGTDPVQELIQLDVTARTQAREPKGSNGRINLNPITSSDSRLPRSISDEYQLLSTQTIAVDIKPRDNQSPVAVVHNELVVDEGGTEIISPDIITVTDADTRSEYLRIVVESPPKYGYLEVRTNAPTTSKRLSAKSSFPLEDLLQERLSYVQSEHRNLEPTEDSFTFHVSDGLNKSPPLEVEIKIENVNDEPPQVTSLPLIVKPGAAYDVTSDIFKIDDLDTGESDLAVAVSRAPLHGHLKKYEPEWDSTEILKESDTFTYDDMLQGYIRYEADPSDATEDEIHLRVTDADGEFQQEAILRVQILQDPSVQPTTSTTTESAPSTISMTSTSSTLNKNDQRPTCRMEFTSPEFAASESAGSLRIPVKRSGDLSGTCSVICVTESRSARNGTDFESRDFVEQSRIFFLKGVTLVTCDIHILDDEFHEGPEDFVVKLVEPEGEGQIRGQLGDPSGIIAVIKDDEDKTLIQFEQTLYKTATQGSSSISVLLQRTGDLRFLSKVRVYTKEVSARADVDFEPVDSFVDFLPGENMAVVDIPLNKQTTKRYWSSSFQVLLSTSEEDRVSADLGPNSYTTVTLIPAAVNGPVVLPAEPYVVSLLHYDRPGDVEDKEMNPGYPVVCVTPCDPKYPRYAETVQFCRNASLDVSKVAFSWEFSPFTDDNFGSVFQQLSDSTLFGSVFDRVLDSSFFAAGSRLRCVARPSVNGTLGLAIRSKPVRIGTHHHICTPPARFSSSPIGQQPFRAVMNYLPATAAEEKHKDRFRIYVEIPHFDGMIPLISTHPLHGVRYLLTEPIYRSQHECSNLKAGFGFLEADAFSATSQYPYQYSDSLRTESSIRLYRHLDLQSCLWNFEAHFSMRDLVDLCGGQITSDYKISSRGRTHVTVRVPLYVAFVTHDHGWSSVEHRTELEFSFLYTPVLVHRGMKTEALTATKPQLTRLTTDSNGRLIIEFKTETQFRGRYLAESAESGLKSELIPPDNLGTDFQLDLVWTREKAGGSEQVWRAVSKYTLHDYSGNYKLRLLPCLADESSTKEKCRLEKATQAQLVISYQLPFKPEPVIYDLNTLFHLTNDRESFLRVPRSIEELKEVDNEGVFSRGQKVYGRVLWYPGHNLSSYQLQIEKLFLCSGQDGHVPAYDPTGEVHSGIPQYGCMDSSSRLKHRILLLNREEPYFMDKNVNGISLEAKFANEIDEMRSLAKITGIDGFVFDVDPLYRLEAGVQWFLQVIYSIKPLSVRSKRSHPDDADSSSSSYPRNGTSIRTITLRTDSGQGGDKVDPGHFLGAKSSTIGLSLLAVLVVILLLVSIVYFKRHNKSRRTNRSSSMLMATATKDAEPSAPSENCTLV